MILFIFFIFEINGGPIGSNTNKRPRENSNSYISDFIKLPCSPLYKDKDFLAQKYLEEGLSIRQIASQIKSSREAVRKGLIRNGIEIRKQHFHHNRKSQARFGTKKRKGVIVSHKTEQRVINVIQQLKASGLSLREIARALTELKIPTKKRGKAWHPQMVKRILDSLE